MRGRPRRPLADDQTASGSGAAADRCRPDRGGRSRTRARRWSAPGRRGLLGAPRRRCRTLRPTPPSSRARRAGSRTRRQRARRRRSRRVIRRSPPSGRPARRAGPDRGPTAPAAGRARPSARTGVGLLGSSAVARTMACNGTAGHSSSSGVTSRPPHRSASRRSVRLWSCCARAPTKLRMRADALPDRRSRAAATGPSVLDEAPEVDGARLGGPAQPRARPPHAGMPRAGRRGVLQVLVEVHAATRCSRMPRASATSSGPGPTGLRGRPASRPPGARGRSPGPTALRARAPAPRAATTPAAPAIVPGAADRAPGCS